MAALGDPGRKGPLAGASGGPRPPVLPVAVVPGARGEGTALGARARRRRAARTGPPCQGAAPGSGGPLARDRADGGRRRERRATPPWLVPGRGGARPPPARGGARWHAEVSAARPAIPRGRPSRRGSRWARAT